MNLGTADKETYGYYGGSLIHYLLDLRSTKWDRQLIERVYLYQRDLVWNSPG